MTPVFTISDSLSFGWRTMRQHSGLVFKIVLIYVALEVLRLITGHFITAMIPTVVLGVVFAIIEMVFGVGVSIVVLKLAQGEGVALRDIIPSGRLAVRYIATMFVAGLCAAGVFVIPALLGAGVILMTHSLWGIALEIVFFAVGFALALFVALLFSMVRFIVIEGSHGIIATLQESRKITAGHRGRLLLFFAVLIALNIMGAALFFIGLLFSAPVTYLAWAHVYLALKNAAVPQTSQTN